MAGYQHVTGKVRARRAEEALLDLVADIVAEKLWLSVTGRQPAGADGEDVSKVVGRAQNETRRDQEEGCADGANPAS